MAGQAVVGALRANLSLNTADFKSGMNKSRSGLRALRAQFLAVAGVATAFGGAITAAAFKGASAIDAVAKSARRLDATNAGFRAFKIAAEEAGVPLSKLSDAGQNLNRTLAEGKDSTKEALRAVGLEIKDLEGLDVDEKFATIADAVRGAGYSAGQTTALMRALGIRTREVANLLTAGGDALRSARGDVEDYGLAISAIDSSRIELANDRIGRLRMITEYVQNQLAIKLVPGLGKLANAMTESLRSGGALRKTLDLLIDNIARMSTYLAVAVTGFGVRYVVALAAAKLATMTLAGAMKFLRGAIIRTGVGALVVGVGEAVYQFGQLTSAVGSSAKAWDMFKDLAKGAVNYSVEAFFWFGNRLIGIGRGAVAGFKEIFWSLSDIVKSVMISAINGALTIVESGLNKMITQIRSIQFDINSRIAAMGGGKDQMIGYTQFVDFGGLDNPYEGAARDAGRRAGEAFMEGFNKDTRRAPKVFDVPGVSAQWKKIRSIIADAKNETGGAADAAERLGDALDELESAEGVAAASDGVRELADEARNAQSHVARLRDMFASTFAQIVTRASSARDAVGELLSRFADMVANNAFQALWNGTLGTGDGGWLGTAASWLFGSIGANANGTNNWRGGPTWVGERGPEIVDLPRGSRVFDAQRSQAMAQGGVSRVQIALSPDLEARILQAAAGQSIDIVQSGLDQYDRAMPARVNQIASDPRLR